MQTIGEGKILKGVGSFYTVLTEDGKSVVCKARGLFRKLGTVPLPGDNVSIAIDKKNGGFITDIHVRRNELVRPAVANIDILLIVVSAGEPEPDPELADKLIIYCDKQEIEPVLIINKCDGGETEASRSIFRQYENAVDAVLEVSAETGYGMERLKAMLAGRTVCLAGQSAVGKSSLINALLGLSLETGELSAKTERGRHTTRHAELLITPEGGFIADTPGFSMLESVPMEPEEIPKAYREFAEFSPKCRFTGCMHLSEPDCAVKQALSEGVINRERYERYKKIANEALEARRHKYD